MPPTMDNEIARATKLALDDHEYQLEAAKALRNITQKNDKEKSTKDDSYPRLLVIDISLLFTVLPKESEILRIPERPYSYDNSINTVTDRWGQVVCFTELSASLILNQVRTAPKFSRTILALVGQTQEHGNGSWVLDVLDLLEVEKDVKASLCVHHIQLTDEDVLQAVIALRQRTGLTQDSIMYLTDNIETSDLGQAVGLKTYFMDGLTLVEFKEMLCMFRKSMGEAVDTSDSQDDAIAAVTNSKGNYPAEDAEGIKYLRYWNNSIDTDELMGPQNISDTDPEDMSPVQLANWKKFWEKLQNGGSWIEDAARQPDLEYM